jgi:hypothetical protein
MYFLSNKLQIATTPYSSIRYLALFQNRGLNTLCIREFYICYRLYIGRAGGRWVSGVGVVAVGVGGVGRIVIAVVVGVIGGVIGWVIGWVGVIRVGVIRFEQYNY